MKFRLSLLMSLCCLSLALEADEPLKKVSLEVNVLSLECHELEELRASIPAPGTPPIVSYAEWCESSSVSLQKLIDLVNSGKLSQDLFWSISIGDKEEATKRLETLGKNYIDLLNQIATGQERSYEQDVSTVCASNCKKIVNGSVWFEGAEHFVPQIVSAGQKVGSWSIELLDSIPGRDGRSIVLRYLVPTEKAGIFNTLVILRCNDQFQITEINEIYNAYEGIR